MRRKENAGRNAFEFSRKGMLTTASFGPMPAPDDGLINRMIDQKRTGDMADPPLSKTSEIVNFLERLFVAGVNKVV